MNSAKNPNNIFLVSGTLSGLGKDVFDKFGGVSWNRDIKKAEQKKLQKKGVDIIIHSAFNSGKNIDDSVLYKYLEDNILLTEKLTKIPHKKFIYISTVDVYPKDSKMHNEDEIINLNEVDGIYPLTKLMAEAMIKNLPDFLILRCSALLGKNSRKNSLMKIIEDKSPVLTLTSLSQFNYVLNETVLDFIKFALEKNLKGIYNLASSQNITLLSISKLLGKKVKYGEYYYNSGKIDNSKVVNIFPEFKKTSLEVVKNFVSN